MAGEPGPRAPRSYRLAPPAATAPGPAPRPAQRSIVRAVLARHPLVAGFADAPPERGGWGATIVRLRH
ncbi:MAG: Smr/MutS family protein [Candidatus Rokubacteria bacterium]|nr:Smr/MutS family protein [Candidatus Rokubacteria bacterium]